MYLVSAFSSNVGAHYVAFKQIDNTGYYYNLYKNSKDVRRFGGYPSDFISYNKYLPIYLILIYDN